MPAEGFLRRWARVKATGADAAPEAPPPASAPSPASPVSPWARAGDLGPEAPASTTAPVAESSPATGRPTPTLEDVAQLTPDSDYSIFVGQGVDKSVQRQALKKLFADPHFNVMDRLDMYMDDYNKPSPVSAAMLASLDHARSALRRMVEDEPATTGVDAAGGAAAAALAQHGETQYGEVTHNDVTHNDVTHNEVRHNEVQHNEAPHNDIPHNEAAHAGAAHDASLAGDAACTAFLPDAGLSDSPNPHLSQGQA
jgi:hypothetical protein